MENVDFLMLCQQDIIGTQDEIETLTELLMLPINDKGIERVSMGNTRATEMFD